MPDVRLKLSSQVEKGRYANFPRDLDEPERIFMLGYEECAAGYIIDRSDFPFWTVEFIVGGHGFYEEDGQQRPLRYGGIFAYGPGVAQYFRNEPERPFRKYFMVSGGSHFPQAWRAVGLAPGRLLQIGNATSIVSVFDQMLDEGSRSDAQTPAIVAGLESVILALLARHQGTARGDKSASRKVYDLVMEIVQRDYRAVHSLADLASRSGYSSEYLCRIFKKYHGESPYQVLIYRKMSAAWLLLRNGQLQVGVVAREVGYEDPLHFSRVFRKVMGCAPSAVSSWQ